MNSFTELCEHLEKSGFDIFQDSLTMSMETKEYIKFTFTSDKMLCKGFIFKLGNERFKIIWTNEISFNGDKYIQEIKAEKLN